MNATFAFDVRGRVRRVGAGRRLSSCRGPPVSCPVLCAKPAIQTHPETDADLLCCCVHAHATHSRPAAPSAAAQRCVDRQQHHHHHEHARITTCCSFLTCALPCPQLRQCVPWPAPTACWPPFAQLLPLADASQPCAPRPPCPVTPPPLSPPAASVRCGCHSPPFLLRPPPVASLAPSTASLSSTLHSHPVSNHHALSRPRQALDCTAVALPL